MERKTICELFKELQSIERKQKKAQEFYERKKQYQQKEKEMEK